MAAKQIEVHLDLDGATVVVGSAWFTQRRRSGTTTVFQYAPSFLERPGVFAIDPLLPLVSGNQYVDALPGAFQDCAPDRWGRNLVDKRIRLVSSHGRGPDTTEVDCLLGVSDRTRQGALRFSEPGSDVYLHPDDNVPRLIDLPHLLAATDELSDGGDDLAAVKVLLEAGSASLGGARPKASVLADDGQLLIAKFPHRSDEWNVMAWECVALDLAERAGLETPAHRLLPVAHGRQVLLVDRFDRFGDGGRRGYMSAMTALSASDGDSRDYLDVADHVADVSAAARLDLAELYRRAAFNVAINNTDDHLRNLGFLAEPGGWRLAPVFDVNPDPDRRATRVTSVDGGIRSTDALAGLVALAEACRLSPERAHEIDLAIDDAVGAWRDVASGRGLPPSSRDRFAHAFRPLATG